MQGRPDAFNPAELFLASIAACMIKGVERVSPMINFKFEGVEVRLHGIRQDAPPLTTISNTVAKATRLEGTIRRAR